MIEDWSWDDVDRALEEIRDGSIERNVLPATLAVIYHDGEVGALLETPPFAVEDADRITAELCRFLPSVVPHQLLLVWPAIYDLDLDGQMYAAKALLWELDGPRCQRVVPIPIHDGVEGDPFEVEDLDPWARQIVAALDAPRAWPIRVDTRFPRGFDFAMRTGSPIDHLLGEPSPWGMP